MINKIKELNFPACITLQTSDISMKDMAERTITSQVKIDGNIKPKFTGTDGNPLSVMFDGEKYVLKNLVPQASKGNDMMASVIDLTFYHWAELELQRYFFIDMTSTASGTAKNDSYEASVSLKFTDFVVLLNEVLEYYFGGRIVADLNQGAAYSGEKVLVKISYTHIWTLVKNIYNLYGVRWNMITEGGVCKIKFGYPSHNIDHVFEYGFNGGLLKVERQVQNDDIKNIILGRGSEENLPARYFKNIDPQNPSFNADPDWVPELKDMYFDGLRDASFRSYVQGWKAKHYGGTVTKSQAYVEWAWEKGYTDAKWSPVEYVKDDSSIAKYGELQDGLAKNDSIKPTLQGMILPGIGRADEIVDVEQIDEEDEKEKEEKEPYIIQDSKSRITDIILENEELVLSLGFGIQINVPEGYVANVTYEGFDFYAGLPGGDKKIESLYSKYLVLKEISPIARYDGSTEWLPAEGIEEGNYFLDFSIKVENTYSKSLSIRPYFKSIKVEYALKDVPSWRTFDVWIKNIWQTSKNAGETGDDYAERVWSHILGDRNENEAALSFTDGLLAHEGYEFKLLKSTSKAVHYDTSKSIGGVQSHWRLTLIKSDAEIDTLGVMMPNSKTNAVAGDHFVFTGIDIPYLYYTEAEKQLTLYKMEYLDKVKDIKPTWVVSLSKTRISVKQDGDTEELINKLKAGSVFKLADKRFIDGAPEELYITSITYSYKEPTSSDPYIVPDIEIVLSDTMPSEESSESLIQEDIESIKAQVQGFSYLLKKINDAYIRRDRDDETQYKLTMGELDVKGDAKFKGNLIAQFGAEFGNFIRDLYSGKGAGIDKDGNAEFESVRVRSYFEAVEYIVNNLSVIDGDTLLTEGDSIERVEDLGENTYGLYLHPKWEGYFTSQAVGNVIKGIINNLGASALGMGTPEGASALYTSWMRVNSVNPTMNYIEVTMYPDEETPTGKNFPPCEMMKIARWGNDRDVKRQGCLYLSSTDGRIVHLTGVTKPIIEQKNYSFSFGSMPDFVSSITMPDGSPIPIRSNLDYAYIGGLIVQDIIRIDFQGNPIVEFVDRGPFVLGDDYYCEYVNPENGIYETSDVWYMGCKYRCAKNLTKTTPAWNNTDWAMIEGNPAFTVDFEDTDYLFDPDRFNVTLTIVAKLYNIDVTDDILDTDVIWTRYSEDADGNERVASDNIWAINRAGAGKSINLTSADVDFNGYIPKTLRYTATVTLRDGMGNATDTQKISFEF